MSDDASVRAGLGSADPDTQEFPNLLAGLGGLGSAELILVDVGQALADL